MKKVYSLIKILLVAAVILCNALFSISLTYASSFQEVTTPEALQSRYKAAGPLTNKVHILIVPGHDDDYWGTQFGDVREADMTLALGTDLYNLLKKDPKLDVHITRDAVGYTPAFANYFSDNRQSIMDFITSSRQSMQNLLDTGSLVKDEGVPHNSANDEVGIRLYGINKWADENKMDLVIHIHFDDYGGRDLDTPGIYSGLTVYIPDNQYGNARVSAALGQNIFTELTKKYPKSNFPPESAGLVTDQDLIALGSNNSLTPASVLTEYGYIYEPEFVTPDIRNAVIGDLAYRTSLGVHDFFGTTKGFTHPYDTTLLPHVWKKSIPFLTFHDLDILSLQAALRAQKVYPIEDPDSTCAAMSGNFDLCTQKALIAFQKKYKIVGGDGILGPKTIAKLNSLYSK